MFSRFRFQAKYPMRALAMGRWHYSIVAEHERAHHLLADVAKALDPLVVSVGREDDCGSKGGLASDRHGAALGSPRGVRGGHSRAASRGQTNGGFDRTRGVPPYLRISTIGGKTKRIDSNKWSELVDTGTDYLTELAEQGEHVEYA
jgi:hypothetical protein